MKRIFDFILSFFGIVFLLPIFLLIFLLIKLTTPGPVFYKQKRVGKNNIDFMILKFRTMRIGSDKMGLLTVGGKDSRITPIGYYLRKFKLDELPQLFNVFIGDMSFVGPRPEVRQYVNLYSDDQKKVLNVKPGITDLASIEFRNESELLSDQVDPENYYVNVIMSKKLEINLNYLKERTLIKDIGVIVKTLKAIV